MKRVLLTGSQGFVGRHCLPILVAQGYEVHAVSSRIDAPPATPPDVNWHRADLLDPNRVLSLLAQVRPTHLLHCAWYAVPGKYWSAPENFRWVESGLHLLRTFVEYGGKRVVGVGSCAEYDWRYGYCSEGITPLNPATVYGVCKHSFQMMLAALSGDAALSATWGRLFFLYGPHEYSERLVASVIRSLLAGKPAPCSHGEQIRDFLYVQDAAEALVALLGSEVTGPVNIASGVPVRVLDVVQEIAAQMNCPELIQLGIRPASDHDPAVLLADITRLRNEVGWSPHYDLAGGLAQTIGWWRLQH